MFTGIIEATADVLAFENGTLALARPASFHGITKGSSIAVAGVCLSVTGSDDHSITFNVVPETLRKTRLGSLQNGDRVNLERAMKADSRVEGHVVQGHCEGTGKVIGIEKNGNDVLLKIRIPHSLRSIVIAQGSIAIDGVSLTVASIDQNGVTVALIPHTLEHTTLGSLKKGGVINIETDILAKYVASKQAPR